MFKYIMKFIQFGGDQKKYMIWSIILGLFQSICEAFGLFASAFAIGKILDGTIAKSDMWVVFMIIIIGILGTVLCSYFSTQFLTQAGYTASAYSRIRIADKLRLAPMGYFNDNNLGQITNVATNAADSLQDTLTRCMMLSTKGLLMTTVITIAMFVFDYRIGFITLAGFLLYLCTNSFMQKAGSKNTDIKSKYDEEAVSAVLEYAQGIAVIKSYNLTGKANKKVTKAIEQENEINFAMEKAFIPLMMLGNLILKLTGVMIIAAAILFCLNDTLSLANALVICIASFMVFNDLTSGGNMSALLRSASNSIDKINAVMDMPVMDEKGGTIVPENCDLSAEHITFSYDKRKIIDDISVSIPKASSLAIVGESGSGKTTLCNLLIRFWDVDEGKITLDGRNLKEYTLESLLKNYSMVFQNVYLFQDTVANNIRFGKPDATMEEIKVAAKKACCHDFIDALPNGYNTMIGEGGASISGGEKQRISIARAMIKDSPIIILDEATANVDPENEWMLQNAIKELTKSKTVIMIAHRLKTVKNADHIIVLDQGKIVQQGKHEELMEQPGIYRRFVGSREKAVGWKL